MNVVCTPTRDTVNAGFTYDLVNLIRYSPDTIFTLSQGTILPNLRNLLVKTSLQAGATHILFIDSDMRFAPDTLFKLLSRNEPIIGANCKQRTQNEWTARDLTHFISSEGKTGVEEAHTLGMGVTLIAAEVFSKIPEPWFSYSWDKVGKKHVGEDIFFCKQARERGYKIMVDHDVSQCVKHAGLVEFGV